jgi:hypothetical protein
MSVVSLFNLLAAPRIGVKPCNISFICQSYIKTVKNTDQSDSRSQSRLSFNTARFGKDIADWSVRHKNTYDAMYDVSVFSNKYKAIQQISNFN